MLALITQYQLYKYTNIFALLSYKKNTDPDLAKVIYIHKNVMFIRTSLLFVRLNVCFKFLHLKHTICYML